MPANLPFRTQVYYNDGKPLDHFGSTVGNGLQDVSRLRFLLYGLSDGRNHLQFSSARNRFRENRPKEQTVLHTDPEVVNGGRR